MRGKRPILALRSQKRSESKQIVLDGGCSTEHVQPASAAAWPCRGELGRDELSRSALAAPAAFVILGCTGCQLLTIFVNHQKV